MIYGLYHRVILIFLEKSMALLGFRIFKLLLKDGNLKQTIQGIVWQKPIYLSSINFCCHTDDKVEVENETQSTNYVDTEWEYGFGRRYAVKMLQELFTLQHFDACDIATRHKELWRVNGKLMSNNYKLCKKEDVPDEILLKCPTILAQRDLEQKIGYLKELWLPVSATIPLAILNWKIFSTLVKQNRNDIVNRIKFFSSLFELPEVEVAMIITRKRFLTTIPLIKVGNNYKLLLEYGISKEEILNDLWSLRYSTKTITERLEASKSANLVKLKTWMIRASSTILNGYIQRRTENKKILGENSVTEYLAERLECTPEQVQVILTKHPALQNKSMPKLEAAIDYLYSAGFQPFQIVRAPKILLHGMETTKKRITELEQKGVKLSSLYILTKSQKQYIRFYESFPDKSKTKNKA